jgi:MarR family 2-MHQ and catechol resistance regulon transcriptional repressor
MAKTTETTAPKLWIVLARAYGSLAAYVEHRMAAEELCLSDFMALEALLHKGPMTMSAIGEKILLANASMTSAIDRLEKRGFVTRNESKEDRRIRMVQLTSEGRKFISELYKRHERDIESVMSGVSATERTQLRRGLKRIGLAAKAAITPKQ